MSIEPKICYFNLDFNEIICIQIKFFFKAFTNGGYKFKIKCHPQFGNTVAGCYIKIKISSWLVFNKYQITMLLSLNRDPIDFREIAFRFVWRIKK